MRSQRSQGATAKQPFKPSPSTKILSINDFITKLLSKLLRDLSNRVHLESIIKLLTDNIFVNGPVFKCPFTKTVSVDNFINKLTNTL